MANYLIPKFKLRQGFLLLTFVSHLLSFLRRGNSQRTVTRYTSGKPAASLPDIWLFSTGSARTCKPGAK